MEENKGCPKCGCAYVHIKESYKGQALFCFNLETGEEGDNSGYYDGCLYKRKNKFVICAECGARVMTLEEFRQTYEKK